MSKTAQRKQSAFHVGDQIGRHIARTMGRIKKPLWNKIFANLNRHKMYRKIVYRAARFGYGGELTRVQEQKDKKGLVARLTQEAVDA